MRCKAFESHYWISTLLPLPRRPTATMVFSWEDGPNGNEVLVSVILTRGANERWDLSNKGGKGVNREDRNTGDEPQSSRTSNSINADTHSNWAVTYFYLVHTVVRGRWQCRTDGIWFHPKQGPSGMLEAVTVIVGYRPRNCRTLSSVGYSTTSLERSEPFLEYSTIVVFENVTQIYIWDVFEKYIISP